MDFVLAIDRLADDSNWARRSDVLRELGEHAADWPTSVLDAVSELIARPLAPTMDVAHSLEFGQRDAARALAARVEHEPAALAPLIARIGRADRVSLAVLEVLLELAKNEELSLKAHPRIETQCLRVLEAEDRTRTKEPGGEGPLARLWQEALALLAHVGSPDDRLASALLHVLQKDEFGFETDPMYRSAESAWVAALTTARVVFAEAGAPQELVGHVRALADGSYRADTPGTSALIPVSEWARVHAAFALRGISRESEDHHAALRRVGGVAERKLTPLVADLLPALPLFAEHHESLIAALAEDPRCIRGLVDALDGPTPSPSLRAALHGLAASRKAKDRELFASMSSYLVVRGDTDALDALLAAAADKSKGVRREAWKALTSTCRDAPDVLAHRWSQLRALVAEAVDHEELATKRGARRLGRSLPEKAPDKRAPAAWIDQPFTEPPPISALMADAPARQEHAPTPRTKSPPDEQTLLGVLADSKLPPSRHLEAIAGLGCETASPEAIAVLAEWLERTPIEPSHDRFAGRLALSLGAAAQVSREAGEALVKRAGRLDFESIPSADQLSRLVHRNAPISGADDRLVDHLRDVFETTPEAGQAGGRWDLILASAASLLTALALRPGGVTSEVRALAPTAARWLRGDATPSLPFDTVTPAVCRALGHLAPLDTETAETLTLIATGSAVGAGYSRRFVPESEALAMAALISAAQPEALPLERLVERIAAYRASPKAESILGGLVPSLPLLPTPTRERVLEDCALVSGELLSMVSGSVAQAHANGVDIDPAFLLPVCDLHLESKNASERLCAVDPLGTLFRAGVPGTRERLMRCAEDRSKRVRERAEPILRTSVPPSAS